MKRTQLTFLALAAMLAAGQLPAGVKVSTSEPVEKKVAFVTAEKKYLTANTGGTLDLTGVKVGSKQTFTIIDLNGGELADGDSVKIRYTPNTAGTPDPTKASYWHEGPGGIKRTKEGDTFKVKQVGASFAFQTLGGKFVGGPVDGGTLGLTEKEQGALTVEIVDLAGGAPAAKAPEQPAAEAPAASGQ